MPEHYGGGRRQPKIAVPMQWKRSEKGKKMRRESQKRGKDYTPFSDGCRELVPAENKNEVGCVTSAINKDCLLGQGMRVRRLTPTECERLQAYPDGWTKFGKFGEEVKEISDSQRYKCLGNSVTTSVIKAIMEKIRKL